MYKIGIITQDLSGWAGGRGLLQAMLNGLEFGRKKNYDYYLFLRMGRFQSSLLDKILRKKFSLKKNVSEEDMPTNLKYLYPYTRVFNSIFYYGDDIAAILKKFSIDVAIPLTPTQLNVQLPCKKIGYIYDFQHEYHSQYFSSSDIGQRRIDFEQLLKVSSALVVTAETVAIDVKKFFPWAKMNIEVLPLYSMISHHTATANKDVAQKKYVISRPYFLVCNQFWRHKGHEILFKTFQQLSEKGFDLVCTGDLDGNADQVYKARLADLVAQSKEAIHILGLIPKEDQLALIRGALALIQPSEFEGGAGAGAVAEALAYGVPCIVSDIPILRELPQKYVRYFKEGDVADLAKVVCDFMRDPIPRPSEIELSEFRLNLLRKMGNALNASIEIAMSSNHIKRKDNEVAM